MVQRTTSKKKQKQISETFIEFVSPSLDAMGLSPEHPAGESIMRVCWTTWNAVVFGDFGGQTKYLEALLDPAQSSPASVVLVQALVERKRSRRSAADDRLIGDYKIRYVGGERRLWAEARDPYPAGRKGRVG
ncbi:hypothetical protein [Thiococcus pfennigii]|uniref:hypothetical protein n=1 Tax=Thiococcus pfennigii TaxID=1057 RepID=UPI0019070FFE|nr:hypothetical protein [Thiococcus pfennigii]MBK1702782.1 hypothetical protein [Thiococcus pfennigii]MBK1733346.1 hypothetical protein [Thiococcus pfennigii]